MPRAISISTRFEMLLAREPKIVCVTAAANTIGTVTPLKKIIAMAHRAGALVMVDAAQAAPHFKLDVKALDCDFLAITGHKLYGPDGIGALYVKAGILDRSAALPGWWRHDPLGQPGPAPNMPMGRGASKRARPPSAPPSRFGTALDFIDEIGFAAIGAHDAALTAYALERLPEIAGLKIIGAPAAAHRHHFLHHGRAAPPRYRHAAGRKRHLPARRASLRPAA